MKHIVFLIAYLIFLYNDIREKKIEFSLLAIYAIVALVVVAIMRNEMSFSNFIDTLLSIGFGLTIFFLAYFSREAIGIADGVFFVISGLLLTLKENMILFLSGMMVAFIIGLFLFYFGNSNSARGPRLPFLPCFLPAIIGYIICIA